MATKISETYRFEKMYDDLIHKYGHEHHSVIQFGLLAEQYDNNNWNKTCMRILYENLMKQNTT